MNSTIIVADTFSKGDTSFFVDTNYLVTLFDNDELITYILESEEPLQFKVDCISTGYWQGRYIRIDLRSGFPEELHQFFGWRIYQEVKAVFLKKVNTHIESVKQKIQVKK